MSIIFSLLLLLLLLGFSLHACECDAPTFGAVVHRSIEESNEKLNHRAKVSINVEDENAKNESNDDVDETTRESEYKSVRWRPHRKKGEAETVFNWDYLPPKTHPPVHN